MTRVAWSISQNLHRLHVAIGGVVERRLKERNPGIRWTDEAKLVKIDPGLHLLVRVSVEGSSGNPSNEEQPFRSLVPEGSPQFRALELDCQ